ncbi:MAG: branched-chain amino acid ABC transporter permease [Firmicutes bacterium]|nr:branched-chain amino acid ABC transporter permease [Bacillota bacterium]
MKKSTIINLIFVLAIGIALHLLRKAGFINGYYDHILTKICMFIIAAVSLNLINGICGQFSLGHAGFMAVGAYIAAIFTKNPGLIIPEAIAGMPRFFVALIIGGLMAAFVGFLVGLPTLRLRGDYLAITTLGFGEIIRVLLLNWKFVGGASGYFGIKPYANFLSVYVLAVITVFIIQNFITSSYGRACIAIREDEMAAETMGIHTTKYKIIAFVLAAFFAGIAGGIYAHLMQAIMPRDFSFLVSVDILLMVVLGGLGSTSGSIMAAIFLTLVTESLRRFQSLRVIIYSLMLIFIMIFRPQGLLGGQELSVSMLKEKIKLLFGRIKPEKGYASTNGTE